MQDSRHQPNPLRPYYIPPSIGKETQPILNATATKPSHASSFAFADLDYADYIPETSPSVTGSVKSLLDAAVWRYTSVVMAQPFEVAKLILQTRIAQESDLDDIPATPDSRFPDQTYDQDEEDDEPNYFSSSAPFEQPTSRSPTRGRRGRPSRQSSSQNTQQSSSDRLSLKNPHSLMDALSSLSSGGGALAMWRGTNSTFLYSVLSKTFETFFRSLLAAAFGIAENDVALSASSSLPDSAILASTSPGATVLMTTVAAGITALLLSPIDASRTRLILTPASQEPRSVLAILRTLSPAWLIPSHLIPITFLTSTIPSFISTATPLFLKSYLNLDPAMNPTSWSIATFAASTIDLSIKFPLETVLRRAQIATWTAPNLSPPASSSRRKVITTIVPVPQSYRGIVPTIWGIMREEGFSESQKDKTAALMGKAPRRKRRGQGIEGLYRGWRVGLWGLVGIWGTSFVGGLQSGSETASATTGIHGGKF